MADESAVMPGTLDLLVLQALAAGAMHGWGLCERIRERSGEVFRVNQGSLYVALERMLARGWIVSAWRTTESHRRARFYTLTASGRRRLERERRRWERTATAMRLSLAGGRER